jgi:uncharacterized repeat protein (TIGR01451 family)
MKKLLLFLFFTLSFCALKSQTTAIPDNRLEVSLLWAGLDNALDGSVLTSAIDTLKYFNCSNNDIFDMTGIEDFIALETLICGYNQFTNLDLSNSPNLKVLDCSWNWDYSLNLNLTQNLQLEHLDIYGCRYLTGIDLTANTQLKYLDCGYTRRYSLDISQNTLLETLKCGDYQMYIPSLNLSAHTNLKYLDCSTNALYGNLNISQNNLLEEFLCYTCNIPSLDVSHMSNLNNLQAQFNKIDSLDLTLNALLTNVNVKSNLLEYLDISNGNNVAIALYRSSSNPSLFCAQVDNASYSTTNWTDVDPILSFSDDCLCGPVDLNINQYSNIMCADSGYAVASTVMGTAPILYEWNTSPVTNDSVAFFDSSGLYTVTVTDSLGCVRKRQIFVNGPTASSGFDLLTYMFPVGLYFPGQTSILRVTAKNTACDPISGQLFLVLDSLVQFDSASISPDIINGDTLIWNFNNIICDSNAMIPIVYSTIDTTLNTGDVVCYQLWISPISGDIDSTNNQQFLCVPIGNSYDPNDKQVFPAGTCDAGNVLNNQLLTYTVRFQNTGSAPAIDVYILDTVADALDLNSFSIVGQSHPGLITELLEDSVLRFRFDNIMLSDSLSNEPESHGYITYQLLPDSNLAHGTYIENSASIYFDFNPPIHTNAVHNTVVDSLPIIVSSFSDVNCDSYLWEGTSYGSSGVYQKVFTSSGGCDSTASLNLTINYSSIGSSGLSICDSLVSPSGIYTYYTTGIYQDTIINTVGCDSVLTLNVSILTPSISTSNLVICDSINSPSTNYTYTSSGTYFDTIANAVGCDSLIELNVTVNYSKFSSDILSSCDSIVSPSGLYSYTSNGTYLDTISTLMGCDSVITLNVSINNPTVSLTSLSNCDSVVSPSTNYTYNATGTYFDTIANAIGCDSLMQIDVTINYSKTSATSFTSCESFTSPSGFYVYTLSGIYLDTIATVMGCDSLLTLNISILDPSVSTNNLVVCDSINSPSTNYTYTSSGTYFDTIANAVGCDSLIQLNLTVNYAGTGSDILSSCDPIASPSGLYSYTISGTYSDTIPTVMGCDSALTLNVTINNTSTSSSSLSDCDSVISPSSGLSYFASGVYLDTISNAVGCDSLLTFNVTVNNSTAESISSSSCFEYSAPSGVTYFKSGNYSDTIANFAGCDSIISINLTIDTVQTDVTVGPTGNVLTADLLATNYQWIDCVDSSSISGEISQSFTPIINGDYAVIIDDNGCIDTSDCYLVSSVSITEGNFAKSIKAFPNPVTDILDINLGQTVDEIRFELFDINSKLIRSKKYSSKSELKINMSDLESGIYLVKLHSEGNSTILRIVKN